MTNLKDQNEKIRVEVQPNKNSNSHKVYVGDISFDLSDADFINKKLTEKGKHKVSSKVPNVSAETYNEIEKKFADSDLLNQVNSK